MSFESKGRLPGWTAEFSFVPSRRCYGGTAEFAGASANKSVLPQMICRERPDGWLECLTKRGRWRIWTAVA